MFPHIDMHCDTLGLSISRGADFLYENSAMLDFARMKKANQMAQFFAIFFPPHERMELSDNEHYTIAVNNLKSAICAHSDIISQALCADDIEKNFASGKTSAVLTIEDGRIIDSNPENLEKVYRDGVRAIALTWNGENCFGYPNSDDATEMSRGLKPFGLEAVEIMNDLGIMVDVSHLSDGGFYDVARVSRRPFIATHSNARALCPHRRNLTDDMLRTLADCGGVTGLNFCAEFIPSDLTSPDGSLEGLVRHIKHIINVGGEDVIALGTDFDGIVPNIEINEPQKVPLIFHSLHKGGVTERVIEKMAYRNVLRVMRDAIG